MSNETQKTGEPVVEINEADEKQKLIDKEIGEFRAKVEEARRGDGELIGCGFLVIAIGIGLLLLFQVDSGGLVSLIFFGAYMVIRGLPRIFGLSEREIKETETIIREEISGEASKKRSYADVSDYRNMYDRVYTDFRMKVTDLEGWGKQEIEHYCLAWTAYWIERVRVDDPEIAKRFMADGIDQISRRKNLSDSERKALEEDVFECDDQIRGIIRKRLVLSQEAAQNFEVLEYDQALDFLNTFRWEVNHNNLMAMLDLYGSLVERILRVYGKEKPEMQNDDNAPS